MKKLLSLVALLALAATLVPVEAMAGLRGAFGPLTNGQPFNSGLANGVQTPSLRFGTGAPLIRANGGIARQERWYAFTTRSQVAGFQTSREIWQAQLSEQIGFLVADINEARHPLLRDPSGVISYTDPGWSPDGRFLAYVQTNAQLTESAIYVQEYEVGATFATASNPIGAPILVLASTPGVRHRHPDWSPDGTSITFDSDASGLSIDVYTIQVFPTVGLPVRRTFTDDKAEQNPAWSPDGGRVAYDTNRFGPNVIEVVDLATNVSTLAETNFASVGHNNPDWSSFNEVYYDAPQNEDAQQNPDIWRLNLTSQAKCPILFDGNGDLAVSVSTQINSTIDGIQYNTFLFESQAVGFGLGVWRANPIQTCLNPLFMGVAVSPNPIDLSDQSTDPATITLSFPIETRDQGYRCNSGLGAFTPIPPGVETVKMRNSLVVSPTFLGLVPATSPLIGPPFPDFIDIITETGEHKMEVYYPIRTITTRMVALGLTDQLVPALATAYSNTTGRGFQGFAYINVISTTGAGSMVRLEQNAPNPFNPVTKIRFAVSKPGNVTLRVYNVQGALVKTLANKYFDGGMHEVSWDGRNQNGQSVSSGVYYAKATSAAGSSDVVKMVMAK